MPLQLEEVRDGESSIDALRRILAGMLAPASIDRGLRVRRRRILLGEPALAPALVGNNIRIENALTAALERRLGLAPARVARAADHRGRGHRGGASLHRAPAERRVRRPRQQHRHGLRPDRRRARLTCVESLWPDGRLGDADLFHRLRAWHVRRRPLAQGLSAPRGRRVSAPARPGCSADGRRRARATCGPSVRPRAERRDGVTAHRAQAVGAVGDALAAPPRSRRGARSAWVMKAAICERS